MPRRSYTDDDKASALALLAMNGGNIKRTSRESGVPRATLTAWAKGRGASARVTELCHLKKGELSDKLESIAHKFLDQMSATIADASLRELAIALGIIIDRMLLLRGGSRQKL